MARYIGKAMRLYFRNQDGKEVELTDKVTSFSSSEKLQKLEPIEFHGTWEVDPLQLWQIMWITSGGQGFCMN